MKEHRGNDHEENKRLPAMSEHAMKESNKNCSRRVPSDDDCEESSMTRPLPEVSLDSRDLCDLRKSPTESTLRTSPSSSVPHRATLDDEESSLSLRMIMPETPDLFRKLDDLEFQWTAQREEHSIDDLDATSILSMGSASFASFRPVQEITRSQRTKRTVPVIVTPRELTRDGRTLFRSGESVFDRLYNQAKVKQQRRRQRSSLDNNSVASWNQSSSVGGSTVSTFTRDQESVHERLYRNERRVRSGRSVQTWSPTEKVERRLNYKAPMDVASRRRHRQRSSMASTSTPGKYSPNNSVFERLYRNQPRPKSQSRHKKLNTSRDTFDSSSTPSRANKGHRLGENDQEQSLDKSKSLSVLSAEYTEDSADVRRSIEWVNEQATIVQSFWRAQRVRSIFRGKKDSAILIQCIWRGYCVRYFVVQRSVLRIQKSWRNYASHQQRCKVETSARTIQRAWSNYTIHIRQRQQQSHFCTIESNQKAVTAQRLWRKFAARSSFLDLRLASVKIQSVWRMYKLRKKYLSNLTTLKLEAALRRTEAAGRARAEWNSGLLVADRKTEQPERVYESAFANRIQSADRSQQGQTNISALRRCSSVAIQCWYRGCRVRRSLSHLNVCAGIIQHFYRCQVVRLSKQRDFKNEIVRQAVFRDRKLSNRRREAAEWVQAIARGYLTRKQIARLVRKPSFPESNQPVSHDILAGQSESTQLAARTIQKTWRCYSVHSSLMVIISAAIRIQATFRCHLCMVVFRDSSVAARQIQNFVRRALQRSQRSRLNELVANKERAAAIRLQRSWRMSSAKFAYLSLKHCAITIQTAFRWYATRRQLKEVAILKVQMWWRSVCSQRRYSVLRGCSLAIQRCYRGSALRAEYHSLRDHAILLQTSYRGYKLRSEYKRMLLAALSIQAWYRVSQCRRRCQSEWLAATSIQAQWRRCLAFDLYRSERACAAMIQAAYRGYKFRSEYRMRVLAALSIQAWYHVSQCRRRYQGEWLAATRIQACWRRYLAVDLYRSERACATMIQAAYRGYRCCSEYRKIVLAALSIQAWYRVSQCRRRYAGERLAATKIQACRRRCLAVDIYLSERACATMIQAAYRGYRCCSEYRMRVLAALSIQAWYHVSQCRRRYQGEWLAATRIQACWRRYLAVDLYRSERACATMIQAAYRGYRCCSEYRRIVLAALSIQAWYRVSQCRRRYAGERLAATRIQAYWRRCLAVDLYCSERACATMIQVAYRGFRCCSEYRKIVLAALLIQVWYRASQCRRRYAGGRLAATRIQACWRRCLAVDIYRSERACAAMIQAAYRGYRCCTEYRMIVFAALSIQAWYRVSQCRRRYQGEWLAATRVQACWRRYLAADLYRSKRACATMIQAAYRGYNCRSEYRIMKLAVHVIQSFNRDTKRRHQWQRLAAVKKIQGQWRMFAAVQGYRMRRMSSILLQSFYRRQRSYSAYLMIRRAVVIVQSSYRRSRESHRFHRIRRCIIAVQAKVRRKVTETRYAALLSAIVTIQSVVRWYLVCRLLTLRQIASIAIQRHWRGFKSRLVLARYFKAIVSIQALARAFKARSLVKRQLRKRRLHNLFDVCATKIQASFRLWLCHKQVHRMKEAAGRIQVLFFTWKLACVLPKLETSVAILERSFYGQLSRTMIRFALLQINSLLRSRPARFALNNDRLVGAKKHAWYRALSRAKQCVCIIIQRSYRGHHCRRLVHRQQRAALLLQLAVRCFLLKQRIHADSLSCHGFYRKRVAVKSLRKLDEERVHVEFCPVLHFRQRHAARVIQAFFIRERTRRKERERLVLFRAFQLRCRHAAMVLQSFARASLRRQAQRRIAEAEAAGVRKAAVERESAELLQRANAAANDEVQRLLHGNFVSTERTSLCIERLARRVRQARALAAISTTAVDDATPLRTNRITDTLLSKEESVFTSEKKLDNWQLFADVDPLLSPIKPIQDGWEWGNNES